MKIEINVYGNPGLYRSLRESFAQESTTHRTFTGAARRLVALHSKAKRWGETTGRWGGWEIIVDGVNLHKDPFYLDASPDDARMIYRDPIEYIAADLQKQYAEVAKS